MIVKIEKSWKEVLSEEFDKPYFEKLTKQVKTAYKSHLCYPEGKNIFRAFDLCPFNDVKVVILGQDPYINPGQAHGLCFSVPEGVPFPPSLKNIFKEIQTDHQGQISSDLTFWAEQGVLLLNAVLTVEAGKSASHKNFGWEEFTDAVIHRLAEKRSGLVYMLWGGFAQKKAKMVSNKSNLILQCPHPSPLSAYRGFFGSQHFVKCNDYLRGSNKKPIQWLKDLD